MVIIRRLIFIVVLLGLAFVFYRFLNPQGADRLISKFRPNTTGSIVEEIINTGNFLSGDTQAGENITGESITGEYYTGNLSTGTNNTGNILSGKSITGTKSPSDNLGVIDDMSGFNEIIDDKISNQSIKGDLNYKNSDYKFSMTFPSSRDGYTIETYTGKEIKSQFVFSLDKKDYFILYVISNDYYNKNKSSQLNYLSYLAQDSKNTFAYKVLENSDTKSKAIPYVLKTFKIQNPASNIPNTVPTIVPTTTKTTVKTTTVKKTTNSDSNHIKNIFDSFVK